MMDWSSFFIGVGAGVALCVLLAFLFAWLLIRHGS